MEEAKELFINLGRVYLLGKNSHECLEFARRYGLSRDQYTVIDSPERISGIRDVIVIRLEGWSWHRRSLEISRALDSRRAVYISESEIESALENTNGAL